jgi:hypothetical protein
MEMFFRMANDKYFRTGICKSYADAMYKLLKKDIEPKFKYFDIVKRDSTIFTYLVLKMERLKILD